MRVHQGIINISADFKDAIVTIGNFDGIHLGHQVIIKSLIREARQKNRKAIVITFDPHPKMVLHPEIRPFYLITSLEEKIKLLEGLGIDAVILIPFSREFSMITAESFVLDILWNNLQVNKIIIGHNYTFGKDKQGNEVFLTSFGQKLGFAIEVVDAVKVSGDVVSSTSTRQAILGGDVKKAANFLGRPFNLSGLVVYGKRRGLGFPTANVKPDKVLIPANGVYAVTVLLEGYEYKGVVNIGFNPTFSNEELSIEVHILDFDKNIYGKKLEVLFVDRIRNEVKFKGPEALVEQIRRDISQAREILLPY